MPDLLTSAVGAIVGSGIGAGVVTFWLNYWKAERDYRRVKIEELYDAIHKYTKEWSIIGLKIGVGRSYEDQVTPELEAWADRIDLLINLYFRQLLPLLKQFQVAMQNLIVQEGQPGSEKRFSHISKLGKELKAEVVELARQGSLRALIEAVENYDNKSGTAG
jgi:hypothetical protein